MRMVNLFPRYRSWVPTHTCIFVGRAIKFFLIHGSFSIKKDFACVRGQEIGKLRVTSPFIREIRSDNLFERLDLRKTTLIWGFPGKNTSCSEEIDAEFIQDIH
jgi:hypothetical protein|tara:strand:+ start:1327 stop:1635 length:309 start_codon:yes stop_codon:yes gene_type:complete